MTYFEVLSVFIVPPLLVLLAITPRDLWRWIFLRQGQVDWKPYLVILAHVIMALVYTTPWDNYLVATNVWWYNPALVTGITIGWVPIEEYTFFILQTLLTGLWTLYLMRYVFTNSPRVRESNSFRLGSTLILGVIWLVALVGLFAGGEQFTYLTLILSWALVPVLIQVFFGADILLANWRLLAAAILSPTFYLWLVDSSALADGTWTINPAQTTGWMAGNIPLEEMVFFFMTNLIIGFGVTLMLSLASQARAQIWLAAFRARRKTGSARTMTPVQAAWIAAMTHWLPALIFTPIVMWVWGAQVFPALATLGVLTQMTAVLVSLAMSWPLRRIVGALALVFVFSWLVEFIGVYTGVPFGSYRYTLALQPQAGGVPLLIPLAWFMMLAPAWSVAEMILNGARLGRWRWPVFAVLSGAAFTVWDLYLDPQMTARGLWIWETPGGFFGIPWVNYLGWWVTSAFLTLLVRPDGLPHKPLYVIYILTWLFQAVGLGLFWGQPGPALAGFVGMGGFIVWAWVREGRHWMQLSGRWWAFFRVPSRLL